MILKKRVVITGLGVVTPIGNDVESFWNNLIAGKSGIDTIQSFDTTALKTKIAGEVKDFDYTRFVDKKEGRKMDRVAQFAVAVAKQAVEDAGIDVAQEEPARLGVCVGTGIGGIHTFLEQSLKYGEKGPGRISPFFIPMEIPNMPAAHIGIALGWKGPNTAIVTACATGTNCIGDAFRTIQYGDADAMIAGGVEAAVNPIAIAGFENMKALCTDSNDNPQAASRPFDKTRSGFVMGEGGGVIVLEELEHAKNRGAHIYAELAGFAMNTDAYHITAPDPAGIMPAVCMEAAIKDAGLTPDDIDYINAHGTSTHRNDLNETIAAKKIFGERAFKVPMSSNKSMTGHLLGGAGGMEAVATTLTIVNGIIPPTMNYHEVDTEEGMDLDYVPNEARKQEVRAAMSSNFGFGGHNAVIVIKKYEE